VFTVQVTKLVQFIYLSMYVWLYSPLLCHGRFFSFLILYTVDRSSWTGDQPVARHLPTHITTQTQNKLTQTSMSWVGFEPMILVFERAKTVHALDSAATVIRAVNLVKYIFENSTVNINTVFIPCEDMACCSSVQCTVQ
jgi:hypothetical protein